MSCCPRLWSRCPSPCVTALICRRGGRTVTSAEKQGALWRSILSSRCPWRQRRCRCPRCWGRSRSRRLMHLSRCRCAGARGALDGTGAVARCVGADNTARVQQLRAVAVAVAQRSVQRYRAPSGEVSSQAVAHGVGADAVTDGAGDGAGAVACGVGADAVVPSPAAPGTEQELLPVAPETDQEPVNRGVRAAAVARVRQLRPIAVASEQMPLPAAPDTEQESRPRR